MWLIKQERKINCSKTTFKEISFLLHFNIHVALTFEYRQQFTSRHGTAPSSNFSIKSLHFHALLHRSLDIEIEIFRGQVKVKQRELNKLWKATFGLNSNFRKFTKSFFALFVREIAWRRHNGRWDELSFAIGNFWLRDLFIFLFFLCRLSNSMMIGGF